MPIGRGKCHIVKRESTKRIHILIFLGFPEAPEVITTIESIAFPRADLRHSNGVELHIRERVTIVATGAPSPSEEQLRSFFLMLVKCLGSDYVFSSRKVTGSA